MALEVSARATGPISLDIAFRVEPGELLALVGHSGSGKTTLLRTIAGLWRPAQARVVSNGAPWLDTAAAIDLPSHRRAVGVVFQNYALFPHMTAAQNILAAMPERDPAARRREAERLLALLNLPGLADRKPSQLSGGQQQRVAVARALARKPEVLLLDEPFSAVDRATRENLYGEIIALRAHLGMPVVLVTHDMSEAQLLADRMAVIERGRLVREGATAEVMCDPQALRAMGLRDVASLLPAVVAEHGSDGLCRLETGAGMLFLPGIEGAPGTPVRVRIMAHEVILALGRPEGISAQNILAGHVARIVPGQGPGVMVHVQLGGDEILARITRRATVQMALTPGQPVHVILKSMAVGRDQLALPPSPPHGG